MNTLSKIALDYEEKQNDVCCFLQRSSSDALRTLMSDKSPYLLSMDEIFTTYFIAKKALEQSQKIKEVMEAHKNKKELSPIHNQLADIVDKQHSLDEKILSLNTNFLGASVILLSGYGLLMLGALLSSTMIAAAGAIAILMGSVLLFFNQNHFLSEEPKMLHDYSLISQRITKLIKTFRRPLFPLRNMS
jgi:hypothetical protein